MTVCIGWRTETGHSFQGWVVEADVQGVRTMAILSRATRRTRASLRTLVTSGAGGLALALIVALAFPSLAFANVTLTQISSDPDNPIPPLVVIGPYEPTAKS